MPYSSGSILWTFLIWWFCDRFRILHQYFRALKCFLIINGNCPVSPYITGVGVFFLTPRAGLIHFRCIFIYHLQLPEGVILPILSDPRIAELREIIKLHSEIQVSHHHLYIISSHQLTTTFLSYYNVT